MLHWERSATYCVRSSASIRNYSSFSSALVHILRTGSYRYRLVRSGVLRLNRFAIIGVGVLLFGLAGCGPGDVGSATGSAVGTANAVVPAGAQTTAVVGASGA